MCFAQKPTTEDLYLMLGYNAIRSTLCPSGIFSRSFDNDDLPSFGILREQRVTKKPVLSRHVQATRLPAQA